MEIYLRKGAIYGFFLGIGLAILFVKYTITLEEYLISVCRIGVIISFLGVLYGWLLFKSASKKS